MLSLSQDVDTDLIVVVIAEFGWSFDISCGRVLFQLLYLNLAFQCFRVVIMFLFVFVVYYVFI
jgi:hypothetical protein